MDERRIIRNGHPGKLMPHCSKYFKTFANAIVCLRCMCLADKDTSGEEGKKMRCTAQRGTREVERDAQVK